MTEEITIQSILTATGMTQTALAKRFDIPLRTLQGWCNGTRKAPAYVLRMMAEILGLIQ